MNDHLRERILRRLDTLSDERGYQVLDFVEFLESRYAERQTPQNAFTKFTEAVEDRLRAGKVSATAIAETMGLMNKAANVLGDALKTGGKMATDFVNAAGAAAQAAQQPSSARPTAGNDPAGAAASGTAASGTAASGTSSGASTSGTSGTASASAPSTPSAAAGASNHSQQPPTTGPAGDEEKL